MFDSILISELTAGQATQLVAWWIIIYFTIKKGVELMEFVIEMSVGKTLKGTVQASN